MGNFFHIPFVTTNTIKISNAIWRNSYVSCAGRYSTHSIGLALHIEDLYCFCMMVVLQSII